MKKTLLIILMLSALFAVYAANDFGYGISVAGTHSAKTTLEVNLFYRPFDFKYCNPFIRAEGGTEFAHGNFGLSEIKAVAGLEIVRSFWNPLQFITVNKALYSPCVCFGVGYKDKAFSMYAEVSPLRVIEKDFITEYLAIGFDFDKGALKDYSVYLFRCTAVL